jgi:hypothetical protein
MKKGKFMKEAAGGFRGFGGFHLVHIGKSLGFSYRLLETHQTHQSHRGGL